MRKDPFGHPLPPRLYWKHGRYWYVRKNKWRKLSTDYLKALQQLAQAESPTGDWARLVEQTYAWYEMRAAGKIGKKLSANTLYQYQIIRARIEYGFAEFAPNQIETSDVTAFVDLYETTPAVANRMLSVIKAIFNRAVRQGLCSTNPAFSVKRFEENKRTRYLTDAEFIAIRAKASPTIQSIMDICYLTARRISDVLAIKIADIAEDGIYFTDQKTGKRLLVKSSDTTTLADAIREARAIHKVSAMYLFHPRGKGTKYGYSTIHDSYALAATKAAVEDTTLHDLRAKSLTDAEAEGLDATGLAAHSSPAMTERYLRLRRTRVVSGPRRIGNS